MKQTDEYYMIIVCSRLESSLISTNILRTHIPGTYFSENALLPGLVKGDYAEDEIAKNFLSELMNEVESGNGQMPIPYLMARLHQLGLEAYIHNFTLHYPLGKPTVS